MKICLNMIVKNESKIIQRCLNSVVKLIDFFVIMDTGSTDGTDKKIVQFFDDHNKELNKNTKIKGIFLKDKFTNFSETRNKSLSVAYQACNCDYILLIDADHVVKFPKMSESDFKKGLSKFIDIGSFYISQQDSLLSYKNTRLIKNNKSYYYKGYTHEVLLSHQKDKRITLSDDQIYIQDLGDGGSKTDKAIRDQKLLLQQIKEEPSFSRSYFYLANTYYGQKNLEEAEKYYRKRISFGGWEQELWYCYYRLGLIKIVQKNTPEAIFFLISSIETDARRLESFFHLLLIFRELRMDYCFNIYLKQATDIYYSRNQITDYLFCEKHIYQTGFRDQFLTKYL